MGVSVSDIKMILISYGLHSILFKDGMVNELKLEEVRASTFVEKTSLTAARAPRGNNGERKRRKRFVVLTREECEGTHLIHAICK